MPVQKSRFVGTLLFSLSFAVLLSSLAQAAGGGLDTPTGVTSLPLQVEGNVAIQITDAHDPSGAAITFQEPTIIKFPFTAGSTTIGTDGTITVGGSSTSLTVAGTSYLTGGINMNSNVFMSGGNIYDPLTGGTYAAGLNITNTVFLGPGGLNLGNKAVLNTGGLALNNGSGSNVIFFDAASGNASFAGDVWVNGGFISVGSAASPGSIWLNGNNTQFTPATCHQVVNYGAAPFYASDARCAQNEFALNGGGYAVEPSFANTPGCLIGPTAGYLHTDMPDADGQGWSVDGFGTPGGEVCTVAYATCCTR